MAEYGPDEFAIIFPEADRPTAEDAARRVSREAREDGLLTVRVGLAVFPEHHVLAYDNAGSHDTAVRDSRGRMHHGRRVDVAPSLIGKLPIRVTLLDERVGKSNVVGQQDAERGRFGQQRQQRRGGHDARGLSGKGVSDVVLVLNEHEVARSARLDTADAGNGGVAAALRSDHGGKLGRDCRHPHVHSLLPQSTVARSAP